jgi:hypothetical protein
MSSFLHKSSIALSPITPITPIVSYDQLANPTIITSSLYTDIKKYDVIFKRSICIGNILLKYDDNNKYIELLINNRNDIMRIIYDFNRNKDTFTMVKNQYVYSLATSNLKSNLINEIKKIQKKFFKNTPQFLFIDTIEWWFDKSYCDDVFI